MQLKLAELIKRITLHHKNLGSGELISHYKYREAEALDKCSIIQELKEYIAREESEDRRSATYFILGNLAVCCDNIKCAIYTTVGS